MELYIHIPFCVRKCRYCDFLSFASDACVREKYVDQLIREIESISEEDAGQCSENAALRLNLTGRTVETIFIGGGTPSLLPPSAVERILAAVRQVFHGDRQDLLNIRVHLAVDHRADQPPESIDLPIFFIGFHSAYFYNLIKAVAIQKTGVPFQVKKYFVQGICSFFLGYCSLF